MKPREFFMDTDLLDKALANCDLGDGYTAKVRQYPHKDVLPQLTHVIEYSAYEALKAQADKLAEALDAIAGIDLFNRTAVELRFAEADRENLITVIWQDTQKAREALEEYKKLKGEL